MWNRKSSLTISSLLIGLGILFTTSFASASLWSFWAEKGVAFIPCNQERKVLAAELAIWDYSCTEEQNKLLEARLRETQGSGEQVGFSVVTGYRSNLILPMSSSQTNVPVSSMELPDGQTLTMALLGGEKVFLTIEPGGSKMELVMCTGITDTTFTGCTRGLSFSGTSTAAVLANQKTHNPSAQVIISNAHYIYDQFVDVNNKAQTVAGDKTYSGSALFYGFPLVSSSGYIGLPTLNGQLVTKYYVDTVGAGGFTALNASTTRGLEVFGTAPETVGVKVSSTLGMAFDADGKIYQKTNTSTGISSDSNGIKFTYTVSSTPAASSIPLSTASGTLLTGWLPFNSIYTAYSTSDGYGSAINAGDAVTIATTTVFGDIAKDLNTGSDGVIDLVGGSADRIAQTFTTSPGANKLVSVTVLVSAWVLNSDIVYQRFQIYAVDGNGKPTGSVLGSADVSQSFGTTPWGPVEKTGTLNLTVSGNTTYALVVTRYTGTSHRIHYSTTNLYNGGQMLSSSDSGTNWTLIPTQDLYLKITETKPVCTTGYAYKSRADVSCLSNFMGFAKTSIPLGGSGEVLANGLVTLNNLSPGMDYYITNTSGTVSTTPGTITKKAGKAVSSTTLFTTLQ